MAGTAAIARLVTRIGVGLGAALLGGGSLFLFPAAARSVAPPRPSSREAPVTVAATETLQVSALELQQLIFTVRAIERLGLNPDRAVEIRRLGPQLAQLEIVDPGASRYVVPAPQTQSLRSLLDSLTPEENTALNMLLLSGLPPSNLALTRQEVETFLTVARQQPPADLTVEFQDALQSAAEDAGSAPSLRCRWSRARLRSRVLGPFMVWETFPWGHRRRPARQSISMNCKKPSPLPVASSERRIPYNDRLLPSSCRI